MTTRAYQNFDLLIEPAADGYVARVLDSPVGQARTTFALPFTQEELRDFFWLTERTVRHLRPSAEGGTRPPLKPQAFGQKLYDAVFTGDVGRALVRSLDAAERQDEGLRIRLRLGEAAELACLPWEYLYATDLARHPALSVRTPIVRFELPQGERPLLTPPPLRILVALAGPSDLDRLDVEKEWQQLHQAVEDLVGSPHMTLERLAEPTLAALQRRLRQGPVHIFHFIGHGLFDREDDSGALAFEDRHGKSHLVSSERLATLLHDHRALRLVFLNACQGAQGGRLDPFAGVAQKLVQQGVPCVLAMQFPISDEAAIVLARKFYRALTEGYPVDAAVAEARKAVYLEGNDLEWGTPVLFSRSRDNQILALPNVPSRLETAHAERELATIPEISTTVAAGATVATGGGAWIGGSVNTEGGNFTGRDSTTIINNYFGSTSREAPPSRQQPTELARSPLPKWAPKLVLIPEGGFLMGRPAGDGVPAEETGQAEVFLPAYRIGRYPVTNREYAEFVRQKGHKAPQSWVGNRPPAQKLEHPVIGVSWDDASAYCVWLREQTGRPYRLPTEAEWEKAARGVDGRLYPWGNEWDATCWSGADLQETVPVGSCPDGVSFFGCYDMLSNVWEWTSTLWGQDWRTPTFIYPYRPDDGREEQQAGRFVLRVLRGGRIRRINTSDPYGHCTARTRWHPDRTSALYGFRVACDVGI